MSTVTKLRDMSLTRADAMRAGVILGAVVLGAIGLLLLARRASGSISTELDVASLTATLALAAVVVFGGRFVWDRLRQGVATRFDGVFAWFGTAALLLLCLGAAWPSSQSWAWLLWLPLVGADWYSRTWFLRQREAYPGFEVERSGNPPLSPPFEEAELETEDDDGASVLQVVRRVRNADGVESVRGTLQAEFIAGQRHATLYVGFCPQLARLPDLEAEVVDGPDASLKVVQAFAHGARLDVRLSEPAEEPCSVVVEFVAIPCDASPAGAAPSDVPPAVL